MPDKVLPGPVNNGACIKEAVCTHTKKVYDSVKDKECLRDVRVYLTRSSQERLEQSSCVKPRKAELLWVYIDVEPVPFNCGFYTVDVRYFYKITAEATIPGCRPAEICGLATHEKRTVLFGSEGNVRIFSSKYVPDAMDTQTFEKTNLPIAVVEVVDPVFLGAKVVEQCCPCDLTDIPERICTCFDDEIDRCSDGRKLYVTLGQFAIIKLERDIQLLMPAYDICMPEKECCVDNSDPCALFEKFKFPVDEFFPPELRMPTPLHPAGPDCGCKRHC